MAAASKPVSLARYLPHVLAATLSVAVLPFVAVYALESSGLLTSPVAAAVVGVVLSVLMARLGAFLWMRHSGSKDLVFGDLMLWGFVRRLRTEKRASDSLRLLGLDRSGKSVREVEMPPAKRGEVLRDLANRLELGDPFTHGHTRRVTRYAYMVAKTMGLPGDTVRTIRAAASVHDVGKIETPQEILNKPGSLTDEEFEIMKRHSVTGAEMVAKLGDPEITEMVRHHHERIDGRGYPDGLSGTEIPLGARVIAVADTFDAIISTRPYRAARRHKEAIEIIKRSAGTQLDEHAVNAFLSYYSGRKPLAWWLSLSTAFQRVFGGFGGWLQHAKAGGLSHGTASLAAAMVLTTGAVAIHPAPVDNERSRPAQGIALIAEDGGRGSGGTVALAAPSDSDISRADGGSGAQTFDADKAGGTQEAGLKSAPETGDADSERHSPNDGDRPDSEDASTDDSADGSDDDSDEGSEVQPQPPVVETPVPPVPPAPPVDNPGDPDKGDGKDKKDKSCGKKHDGSTDEGDDTDVSNPGDKGNNGNNGDDKACRGKGPWDGKGPGKDDKHPCDDEAVDETTGASSVDGPGKGPDKACGDDKGKDKDKDGDKDGDKDKDKDGDKDEDTKGPTDKDKGTKDEDDDTDADTGAGDDLEPVEGDDDSDDAVDEEVVVVDEAPVVEEPVVEEPVVVEVEPVVVEETPPAVEPEPVAVESGEPEDD